MQKKQLGSLSWKKSLVLILKGIGTGAVIISVIVAPQMASAFSYFGILDDPKRRHKLVRKLKAMQRHGYIKKTSHGYRVTSKGTRSIREDELWHERPHPIRYPEPYLHLCMFDIPVKKERSRQAFRALLRDLGYERFQNSVFASRCDHEVTLVRVAAFYGIARYVRFLKAKETNISQL